MLTRCTRGFRLKANDQISQISLIDHIRNLVGIKLYFTTFMFNSVDLTETVDLSEVETCVYE